MHKVRARAWARARVWVRVEVRGVSVCVGLKARVRASARC